MKAIRLDPKFAHAYNNRGFAYAELSQYERAIEDYNEAIHLNPDYALAYGNRALVYTLLGRDAEAKQDIDQAIELGIDRTLLEEIEKLKKQSQFNSCYFKVLTFS